MGIFKIGEVFLVDDDDIVKMVATKILKSIGFENTIYQFENGKTAIVEIKKRVADQTLDPSVGPILILLDINMPIMDAWGFLDEFTKLDQDIKDQFLISIITSSIDSNDRNMAFSYPDVKDYITKPLSGKHVIDFLTKHQLYEQ
ncbi:MAG TPA: response regulator [Algoriphagus sp.]|nr:response regulator [Algoriphagus sp.]